MRQSLRKRSSRYKAKRQIEFSNYQKLLKRMKARFDKGVYSDSLTPTEVKTIKTLLSNAIFDECVPLIIRLGLKISVKPCTLETSRRAYYAICRILRTSGQRPASAASDAIKVVRRSRDSIPD